MSNFDVLTMAIRNLFKRKTRTFLTILGVVIGTVSIVVMISLGLAMNQTYEEQLANLGDITIITVHRPYDHGQFFSFGGMVSVTMADGDSQRRDQVVLDQDAVERFKRIPGVTAASAMIQTHLYFGTGKYIAGIQVYGIEPEAMEPLGFTVSEGRLLAPDDKKNVVFGAMAAYSFRDPNSRQWWVDESGPPNVYPMEARNMKLTYNWDYYSVIAGYEVSSEIPLKLYDTKAVGTLEFSPNPNDWLRNYGVFMDIKEVRKLMEEQQRWEQERNQEWGWNPGTRDQQKDRSYDTVLVKCDSLDSTTRVKEILDEWGFPNSMPAQALESMKNIANSLQTFLATVGAVALLVSALGITNTMVTAIYERTKEIGVMKVIGASLGDIRRLFLMEAALLGFAGGLVGVGISLAVSHFINTSGMRFLPDSLHEFAMQTTVSLITPELCGIAILFATIMGIVAGFFPANRAMRLSVLTAIRTE